MIRFFRLKFQSKAFWLLLIPLLFFVGLLVYKDSALKYPIASPIEKIVEVNKSVITGYYNQHLSWTIQSDYIWAGQNKYFFTAEQVQNGSIFDSEGVLVADQIMARNVNVNTQSKSLFASGFISARFVKHERSVSSDAVFAKEESPKEITIKADNFRYFSENKKTYFYNNVVLTQGKAMIYTDNIIVDNDKNIAFIDQKFTMKYEEFVITGNQMMIYIDDDYSEILGQVSGFRDGKPTTNMHLDERERAMREKKTFLMADYLKYTSKPNDENFIELRGNIHIFQDDKSLWGEEAFYDSQSDVFDIHNRVKFTAKDLNWAVKKKQKAGFRNADMKKSIDLSITAYGDQIVFDAKNKNLKIQGMVRILQADKNIECQTLELDDAKNQMLLTGKVRVMKNKTDQLKCERIRIDLNKESFFADSGIESVFKLKKNKSKSKQNIVPTVNVQK